MQGLDDQGNFGREIEDYVEQLCANSFFSDFTIRSPKYRKAAGEEKEAADLLVFFGGTLLIIQIKSRRVDAASLAEFSAVDSARFTKTIGRAFDQFRGMLEAWDDPAFGNFTNGRGMNLVFKKTDVKNVIMIVVIAPLRKDGQPPGVNLRCRQSCLADGPIPLHVFQLIEFSTLTKLSDTFPDFLSYLETRAYLHSQNLIPQEANPVDLWAFITFERRRLLDVLHRPVPVEVAGLMDAHAHSLKSLEETERPSYFIDWLIERLHAGLRHGHKIDQRLLLHVRQLAVPGSALAYSVATPFLAKLRRSERVRLSEEFFIRVERSRESGLSFAGVQFEGHAEMYLVLSAAWPRVDRQVPLFNVARALVQKQRCAKVICIATGPEGPEQAGCDVMVVDAANCDFDSAAKRAAEELFQEPHSA